jgi:hypothetical protein
MAPLLFAVDQVPASPGRKFLSRPNGQDESEPHLDARFIPAAGRKIGAMQLLNA